MDKVIEVIDQWVNQKKIAGANIIISTDKDNILSYSSGYADIENNRSIDMNTIFRLASMTKPVIAVAIMKLVELNKLSLEAPLEKYLPIFSNMKVSKNRHEQNYEADPENPFVPKNGCLNTNSSEVVEVNKPIVIKELLNHSSGLGQGAQSIEFLESNYTQEMTLSDRVKLISSSLLDFHPGTATGYSATTAYDVLGFLVENISEMSLNDFIIKYITDPLEIEDLAFYMNADQEKRYSKLYEFKTDCLIDVSDTESLWNSVNPKTNNYLSGSAGMSGTIEAYSTFAKSLLNHGKLGHTRILSEESIHQMISDKMNSKLEMGPGVIWGLGMTIFGDAKITNRFLSKGSYGWSGAYGTHFYVDPLSNATVTLGVNCSNIGGASSLFSHELEETIYTNVLNDEIVVK